jgi:hypothetical protein
MLQYDIVRFCDLNKVGAIKHHATFAVVLFCTIAPCKLYLHWDENKSVVQNHQLIP